jgi:hypothetical protein
MGRKRKHTGKYYREDLRGKIIGDMDAIHGVILSDRHDKYGHRYVMVQWFCNPKLATVDRNCPACHGEPVEHRYDKIQAGRVTSCGRLKKQRYRDYLQRKTKYPDIDVTGKPIPATARKKGKQRQPTTGNG